MSACKKEQGFDLTCGCHPGFSNIHMHATDNCRQVFIALGDTMQILENIIAETT